MFAVTRVQMMTSQRIQKR